MDYFTLYLILVSVYLSNFSSTFFYEQKKTHERSVPAIIVSFTKSFSKHPDIFPILKVVSEYLRLPFKLTVDYFIFYSILVSFSVIFHQVFAMNKRRCTDEVSGAKLDRLQKDFQNILTFCRFLRWFPNIKGSHLI